MFGCAQLQPGALTHIAWFRISERGAEGSASVTRRRPLEARALLHHECVADRAKPLRVRVDFEPRPAAEPGETDRIRSGTVAPCEHLAVVATSFLDTSSANQGGALRRARRVLHDLAKVDAANP